MAIEDDLGRALRLAGFTLVHALWSVSDGEALCTLAMMETGHERALRRFEGALEEVVPEARGHLAKAGVDRWVLVWDGYVTPVSDERKGDRIDALIADIIDAPGGAHMGAVVRYRPKTSTTPFAVLGPVQIFADDGSSLLLDEPLRDHLRQGLRDHPALAELTWEEFGKID